MVADFSPGPEESQNGVCQLPGGLLEANTQAATYVTSFIRRWSS